MTAHPGSSPPEGWRASPGRCRVTHRGGRATAPGASARRAPGGGPPGHRRRRWNWLCLLTLLVLVLEVPACRSTPGEQEEESGFARITDASGEIRVSAHVRREVSNPTEEGTGLDGRELALEQNVALALAGFIYHPNLVTFDLGGRVRLVERSYREEFGGSTRDGNETRVFFDYDVKADILSKKKYPGSIFARSERHLEWRSFRASVETQTTAYGLLWNYLDEVVPTTLQVTFQEIDFRPLDNAPDGNQDNFSLRLSTAYVFSERSRLRFRYERRSLSQRPNPLDLDADEMWLEHDLEFGDDVRNRLRSYATYLNQTGDIELERLRLREVLDYWFSDSLRSQVIGDLEDRTRSSRPDVSTIDEFTWSGRGLVEHRLYKSLFTTVSGYYRMQDLDGAGEIEEYGGRLDLRYVKKTPIGFIHLDYGGSWKREDRTQGEDLRIDVLDESHTFHAPLPIVLDHLNVDISTIVVTATDNFTVYIPGIDYQVFVVGDRTEIHRLPGGSIVDGQTVLVDYTYVRLGQFALDTENHNLRARFDFDFGLAVYYGFRKQNQSVDPSSIEGVTTEDLTSHVFGVEYRTGGFDCRAEYETRESNIDPFDVILLDAGYAHQVSDLGVLTLRAGWTRYDRRGAQPRVTRAFVASVGYRGDLTDRLSMNLMARYRNAHDSITGRDDGFDVDLRLDWVYGRLSAGLHGRYQFTDSLYAERDAWSIFIESALRF